MESCVITLASHTWTFSLLINKAAGSAPSGGFQINISHLSDLRLSDGGFEPALCRHVWM